MSISAERTHQLPEKNLEILGEAIVCQISRKRKKVYFIVVYRSPSQTADEFEWLLGKLELSRGG